MTDVETLFRAPRLTRLEIQGFKSFLNRTTFAFEPGITAIVGPNGSGKSNVADALRWVLGEQGQNALRARKTEDVIFSGGQGRARAGMAEATLTFDNSDGWLPTEFAEVSVTRRAFRSGENQYLINGRRVRLKDVAILTAGLGQSHVVVGQGLVDAALSLRAEERRGLFEHAADLTGLRLKVAEAERNLAETDANTTRLSDVLTELEPRLKSLERAARQAREWQGIRDRLRDLQGSHYRQALEQTTATLSSAKAEAEGAAQAALAARAEESRFAAAADQATDRLANARSSLAEHEKRRATIEERLRRQTHERDLAAARSEALARRHADMDDAREGLDERVASVAAELKKLALELRDLERATTESREATGRHNRELTARRHERGELEKLLSAASRQVAESERAEGVVLRRRAVLVEREAATAAERERLLATISERELRISTLTADVARAEAASSSADERGEALVAQLAALAVSSQSASQQAAVERADVDRLQQQFRESATRLDVLRRLQESGAGLHGGVKEVVRAARDGRLTGVLGTVAELIIVPKPLEIAIEVALGGRLQDVVVERWADAEAAIAHLKLNGSGRATFQPLDTVTGGSGKAPAANLQRLGGFLGVASDLVGAPAEIAPVVSALLGRTVVVEELQTARAALPHLNSGWSVVTLAGEIARAGGSVTGGSSPRESGSLARERELRELPIAIAAHEEALALARERAAAADTETRRIQDAQRQLEGERAALRAAAEERRQQRTRLESWLGELRGEQERSGHRLHELATDGQRVQQSQRDLDHELSDLLQARDAAAETRRQAEIALADLATAAVDLEKAVIEEGRRLAGLEERLRSERRREAGLRAQDRALADELALRAERTAHLDREMATLAADHARLGEEVNASTAELTAATAERLPLREEALAADSNAERMAQSLQAALVALVERERERDHAEFALERITREWNTLRNRIVEDLDFSEAEDVLSWQSASADLQSSAREAEIGRLRERLRRVGYVGDDAVADFERESQHQAYLREQLADVQGAAAALRELLADLRQTMRARFDETFSRVAREFAEAFSTLFGGGTAQLVLTTGDNGAEPGIEIIAQPPGKRLQSLALLSGGERALTAAALLFAILKVNPVPFCLLDEVDAALDEANVVRFREHLQELGRQTQFIVVTHNRGTIEIADTLYGVSMGADGVSQVLSLRMSESLAAD